MRVAADSLADALVSLGRISAVAADFRPFWKRLQAGPLGSGRERGALGDLMQQRWNNRFDLNWEHTAETVEARTEGLGIPGKYRRGRAGYNAKHGTYYKAFSPGRRAMPAWPYLEWTGALRAAASGFTTLDQLRADIDPQANYRGPLEEDGGWDLTRAAAIPDDKLYPEAEVEAMLERELEAWIDEEVAAL